MKPWTAARLATPAFIWIAALSVQAGPSAHAPRKPADCAAAERDKPTLSIKRLPSARFRMATDVIGWENTSGRQFKLTLRHGVETADLKNGVRLRVILGACEAYVNTYEFTLPEAASKAASGSYWLAKASELIAEVAPANIDDELPLQDLSAMLAQRAKNPKLVGAFPKEDLEVNIGGEGFSPFYRVTLNHRAGRAVLTVGYGIRL